MLGTLQSGIIFAIRRKIELTIMKNIKLTALAVIVAIPTMAQKNNLQTASSLYRKAKYAEAKEYIDLAAENEATNSDPKTLYLKGGIYMELFRDTTTRKLVPNGLEVALKSASKSIDTDEKEAYTADARGVLINASLQAYDQGARAYSAEKYEEAIKFFNIVALAFPYDKDKTLSRNNVNEANILLYSGYAANQLGKTEEAMKYFQQLVDKNAADPALFITMSRSNLAKGDTTAAIEIVGVGRKRFETDQDLIKEELYLYESQGKTDVLLQKLTEALEYDPGSELLLKVRAQIYESMREYDKAELDYKGVLEYDEYNFDANYAVGAMFFNAGVAYNNDANQLSFKETTKIDAFNKKADGEFKRALPYLEKALEVKPDDNSTMQALKQLYVRLSMTEEYKEIKALIEANK
jgi:tetratricopeptide (TPR) repeat protein